MVQCVNSADEFKVIEWWKGRYVAVILDIK